MSASNVNVTVAHNLRLEGIKRYAEADKSDPFCYARCMTHYLQGITKRQQVEGHDVIEAQYDAKREPGGWSNRVRP